MLETFYTKQEYYIHLKISGYVQGPQSKVESGEYEPVWVNILGGLGGGGVLPPENLNFLDVLKWMIGGGAGEAKAPFPTPNISAVPEAI